MHQKNLYANERLMLVLTFKQINFSKFFQPHIFFLNLGEKIRFSSLKFTIKIFGLSTHHLCISQAKLHTHVQFHTFNILRTAVFNEKN